MALELTTTNETSMSNLSTNTTPLCINLRIDDPKGAVIFGFLVPAMCFFGFGVNFLGLSTALSGKLKAPTYAFIAVLSIIQALALACQGFYMVGVIHYSGDPWVSYLIAYFLWPVYNATTTLSLILVAGNTIQRYVYVRKLTQNCQYLITKEATYLIIFVISIFVTIATFPRMSALMVFSDAPCCLQYRWNMKTDYWFSIYTISRFLALDVGPILLTLIFSLLLLSLTKRCNDIIATPTLLNSRKLAQQRSLTIALIVSTTIALIAEIYASLFNPITENFVWGYFGSRGIAMSKRLSVWTFVLLLIEYCSNFVIYTALGQQFRAVLISKLIAFCMQKELRRGSPTSGPLAASHSKTDLQSAESGGMIPPKTSVVVMTQNDVVEEQK